MADLTEQRVDITERTRCVLAGIKQSAGVSANETARAVLDAWAAKKLHEATVICNIARGEVLVPASSGHDGGKA